MSRRSQSKRSRDEDEKPARAGAGRKAKAAKAAALPPARDAAVLAPEGTEKPFWETKTLKQMTPAEWDSLCDGCGQCCLNKIEDEDTGKIFLTRLSCSLLDLGSCRCKDYENRFSRMPDCLSVDLKAVRKLKWLPESCAYRRLHEGRGLAWWHPLISGDPETVHQAGVSVRGWAKSEKGVSPEQMARYIIGEAG